MPLSLRNETQRINHVRELDLKVRLTKDEWDALRKYARSRSYPALKSMAAGVLEHKRRARELHKPAIEKISYSDLRKERKEELRDLLRDDLVQLFELTPGGSPTIGMMRRFEKEFLKSYIPCSHLQVIPDRAWSEMLYDEMMSVAADFKEDTALRNADL
jgi:transposase InsO family protein